jgi:hypothetical protein
MAIPHPPSAAWQLPKAQSRTSQPTVGIIRHGKAVAQLRLSAGSARTSNPRPVDSTTRIQLSQNWRRFSPRRWRITGRTGANISSTADHLGLHAQYRPRVLSAPGHGYRMGARHGAPSAKPTTHVTLSMQISVFDLTKSSLACAARRNVAASASVVTHRRPRFSQRALGQTSRRRLTSSGFDEKRIVAIPEHPLETQHGTVPHRRTRAQLNAAIGSGSSN